MNNLDLYNKARGVPNEAKKPITAGRLKGFTDINPMWRIKRLTELFGPCGFGWWYEIVDKQIVSDEVTKQKVAFVDILLFYVDPATGQESHGIPGTGGSSFLAQEKNGPYLSDECFKMALTDAISVAAKSIGVGADVYYEKDRDKYNNPTGKGDCPPPPKQPQQPSRPAYFCADCGEELVPYNDQNGKPVSIKNHVERSHQIFGRCLCINCIQQIDRSGEP